jgi:hypothetical protein
LPLPTSFHSSKKWHCLYISQHSLTDFAIHPVTEKHGYLYFVVNVDNYEEFPNRDARQKAYKQIDESGQEINDTE